MPTQRTSSSAAFDVPALSSSLVLALGLVALVGWFTGVDSLASFGSGRIPMAPSTAVLFALFGTMVIFRAPMHRTPGRLRLFRALAFAATGVAAVLLVTSSLRITSDLETAGIALAGTVGGAPVGHMSPLTALGFVLVGVAFLSSVGTWAPRPVPTRLALVLASFLILFGAVLVVAYALGGPILYGSGLIPPALSTSLAFLVLGVALTTAAAQGRATASGRPLFPSKRTAARFAVVSSVAIALIVSVAYTYFRIYRADYLAGTGRELAAVADLKAKGIVEWRYERLGDVRVLAESEAFALLVKEIAANPHDARAGARLRAWLNNVRAAYGYERATLLTVDDHRLFTVPDSAPLPPPPPPAEIARIRESGRPGFVDFHGPTPEGAPRLGVAAPIVDPTGSGRDLAVLYLRIDPEAYLYPFLRGWPSRGMPSARTLLVRRQGDRAIVLNASSVGTGAMSRWVSLTDTMLPAARAALGREGVVLGPNESGVEVEAALTTVPDSPWFIETRVERQEVLAPLRERLWWVVAFTGLLLVVLAGGAAIAWQDHERRHFRLLAEAQAKERSSQARYRALFNSQRDAILVTDTSRHIMDCNPAFEALFGYRSGEITGGHASLLYESPETAAEAARHLEEHPDDPLWVHRTAYRRKDGRVFPAEVNIFKLREVETGEHVGYVGIIRDVTELRLAEEERERLSEQLTQAQKLESVGRLAGGVAHDFNNMLSVILGHTELALASVPPDASIRDALVEIQTAADRSAKLTRQLLAFARRQMIRPEVLDLGVSLSGMSKMLRRLIGEDVELEYRVEPDLWPVRVDPVQLDQVLANLVVNARDAIPGTGRVTIEAANLSVDEAYAVQHPDATCGDFVMLAVSDSGVGMPREVMEHLFEPFFTTKPRGKGTGLGLATVYGILRQNGGFANVYSEPGHGTTIRLYFPRHGKPAEESTQEAAAPIRGQDETILVVEDESSLLRLATRTLVELGYRVLPASAPEAALDLAEQYTGEISLLLTDVIMPRMNGKDLAERLRQRIPGLPVLFMSGYAGQVLGPALEDGIEVLQKPFNRTLLSVKIRDALEGSRT